jgi:hypothetical protein
VIDFDFNPTGGQDRLDISALGITAASFGTDVSIASDGGIGTLITIGANSITLAGVAPADITIQDFLLAL